MKRKLDKLLTVTTTSLSAVHMTTNRHRVKRTDLPPQEAQLMTLDQSAHRHNNIQTTRYFQGCLIIIIKTFFKIQKYIVGIQKESPQCHWDGSFEHQASTLAAALELHIAPSSCISPFKSYLLLYHKLNKTINEPLKPPQYNMIFHAIVFLVNMVFSSGYFFCCCFFFNFK